MKKLKVDIKIDLKHTVARQKQIEELRNNQVILDYLNRNNLPTSFIEENVGILEDYLLTYAICQNCKGLEHCKYAERGAYKDTLVENSIVSFAIKKCDFLLEREKRFAHLNMYQVNHLREEFHDVSIFSINVENESADYLKICNDIITWLDKDSKKGVYFYGGFGVGKTYLAACISNELAKNGKSIAFINSSEFCNEMRLNWNNAEFLQQTISKMKNLDLLVIDDIGSEVVTNWVRDELLFPILDGRMGNRKLTLFTSNYNYEELLKHFVFNNKGEKDELNATRFMERIQSLSTLVTVKAKNRRLKEV